MTKLSNFHFVLKAYPKDSLNEQNQPHKLLSKYKNTVNAWRRENCGKVGIELLNSFLETPGSFENVLSQSVKIKKENVQKPEASSSQAQHEKQQVQIQSVREEYESEESYPSYPVTRNEKKTEKQTKQGVFYKKATNGYDGCSYKFYFMNFNSSDISQNLKKFSKQLVKVRILFS